MYVVSLSNPILLFQNAHCECPAGCGPTATCKHIVGVLLLLAEFVKTGILKVQLSCTEQLQTFKKPAKIHKGSPVKAEQLGRGTASYDPRPLAFRNMPSYRDHVFNATINYCAMSQRDISLRYAIPRANLQQAEQDHDYLAEPLTHC